VDDIEGLVAERRVQTVHDTKVDAEAVAPGTLLADSDADVRHVYRGHHGPEFGEVTGLFALSAAIVEQTLSLQSAKGHRCPLAPIPHPRRVLIALEDLGVDGRVPQHGAVRAVGEVDFFLQMSGFHLNLLAAELSVLRNINPWLAERRHEVERMSIEATSVHDMVSGYSRFAATF